MQLDIGAKRPIEGDHVFLAGRPRWPSEPSFVLLHDPAKLRESKRNVRIDVELLVQRIGAEHFVSVSNPVWGTAWFRRASIRRIIEMSPRHLALSSTEVVGSRVIFVHEPEKSDDSGFDHGFSLYGVTPAQASEAFFGDAGSLSTTAT